MEATCSSSGMQSVVCLLIFRMVPTLRKPSAAIRQIHLVSLHPSSIAARFETGTLIRTQTRSSMVYGCDHGEQAVRQSNRCVLQGVVSESFPHISGSWQWCQFRPTLARQSHGPGLCKTDLIGFSGRRSPISHPRHDTLSK